MFQSPLYASLTPSKQVTWSHSAYPNQILEHPNSYSIAAKPRIPAMAAPAPITAAVGWTATPLVELLFAAPAPADVAALVVMLPEDMAALFMLVATPGATPPLVPERLPSALLAALVTEARAAVLVARLEREASAAVLVSRLDREARAAVLVSRLEREAWTAVLVARAARELWRALFV